ncbi:MAG: lipocalin-like domain-containing protein [Pseudomonadota bacterium]
MTSAPRKLSPTRFYGVWRLERWELWRDGELYAYPHGEISTGQIIYSSAGVMSAVLQNPDWPKSGDDGPPVYESFLSYSGLWRVEGQDVHHDVHFASISSWVGRRLTRRAVFGRKQLRLESPPQMDRRGRKLVNRVFWRKDA